jgi:hypothetical protein
MMWMVIGLTSLMVSLVGLVLFLVKVFKKDDAYKKWGTMALAFFMLFLVSVVSTSSSQAPATTTDPVPATTTDTAPATIPTPDPAPAPKNEPTMTMAEFDQIKNGMTYEEVTAIVGGPGEMVVETGTPGDQYYTVAYKFNGEGSLGANAQLMFQGGKLNMKAQAGLK